MLALTWAGWFYVCWVHRGRWYWRFAVFAAISVILCYLSARTINSHLVAVTFKEPPRISLYVKLRVRFALTKFNAYLSDVGFDTRNGIPPVGFTDGDDYSVVGGVDSTSVPFVLTLPRRFARNDIAIDNLYLLTVISPIVGAGGGTPDLMFKKIGLTTACTDYFMASYLDYLPPDRPKNPWLLSLWEIRGNPQFGRAKTDRIVLYALQQLHDHPATGSDNFEQSFYWGIDLGVRRTSNNVMGDLGIVSEAFKRHGLEFK